MSKPIVHFKADSLSYVTRFYDGQVASVYAWDHPRLGHGWVMTSEVLKKNPDGSFETRNTIYVPAEETN
jgi:hypothetical protein